MGPYHIEPYHMGPYHMEPYHMGPYHMGPYHMESWICYISYGTISYGTILYGALYNGPFVSYHMIHIIWFILYGPHWTIWYQPFVMESVYHLHLWIQTLNFSF